MTEKKNIWQRKNELEKARLLKMRELIEDYDREIHNPQLQALREECGALGHGYGHFHDNGLGWSWNYCNNCGGRFGIMGPNGERE
jgi:hypothetical protein